MGIKPRVAIVTPGSYPIPSSRSSSVEQVVRHVGKLLGDRIDLWVLGKKTYVQPVRETVDGVRYIRPRCKKGSYTSAVSVVVKRLRPHVIQVENRPSYVIRFKRRHPLAQVWLSLHSTTFLSPWRIRRSLLRRSLLMADRIIVNSGFLRDYIVQRFPFTASKVYINTLGVDTSQFVSRWSQQGEANRAALLSALGYENKRILLYVGRLIEKKGVHHLLEAMPSIIERHPDTVLVVVGSADYGVNPITPYVQRLHAMGNTMPNHVRFIQFVPHNEVHRWFSIADVVLVPSFAKEAFGLVNVEAMATGVPVVATRAGGMKELIVNGVTGFLIPVNSIPGHIVEKVDLFFNNPELARVMGEASLQRVKEHFTWEHTARRLAVWYSRRRIKRR